MEGLLRLLLIGNDLSDQQRLSTSVDSEILALILLGLTSTPRSCKVPFAEEEVSRCNVPYIISIIRSTGQCD